MLMKIFLCLYNFIIDVSCKSITSKICVSAITRECDKKMMIQKEINNFFSELDNIFSSEQYQMFLKHLKHLEDYWNSNFLKKINTKIIIKGYITSLEKLSAKNTFINLFSKQKFILNNFRENFKVGLENLIRKENYDPIFVEKFIVPNILFLNQAEENLFEFLIESEIKKLTLIYNELISAEKDCKKKVFNHFKF
ncbi:hypothetical protein EDEG_02893 [Edhazardia aedis USNM 41457]|uniref:Uncharacterized protein n=1 Tax=Edhazardia aedis (strain USNM 41457) TaxID=1003232 RepID=J9D5A1_EDHAE|nr:hypothetical protein EDEG_02893 [Edhazardia aedis USNM 41457]|eukprot:EJW02709.1 hypothetical protein EDEG_02893 [Edhazardia aedis USNM 41457]